MDEICTTCGLPKNICVCTEISKGSQKIKIKVVRTHFKKFLTTVSGLDDKVILKELGKTLKTKLACGGTIKENEIVLQGDHRDKVKKILLTEGFKEELIDA